MRGPRSLEDFARLARVAPAVVERYRDAGLLDPDQDGLYDEFDALRLQFINVQLALGRSLEDVVKGIEGGQEEFAPFGGLLFHKGRKTYTVEEAAEIVGLEAQKIQELRTASGLPGAWTHELDLDTFRAVRQMLEAGMPWEALLEGGRVWGDAMRRIAEVEMRLAHRYLHEPLAAAGVDESDIVKMHVMSTNLIQPLILPLLTFLHEQYALRAQVEDVLMHLESVAGRRNRGGSMEATILFVDLSSFTALAQVHGDEVAAEVLDRFDGLVRSLVHEHRGTLVKQIGDAFMLTFVEPADSVQFALALDAAAGREEHFPSMRMGIHAGPVLYRVGDYVGTTVNVASRIAGAAMPNEIVTTEPVAKAAEAAGIEVGALGVRMLRGINEPLTLYRVVRGKEPREFRDPVCGMTILEDAAARLTWGGIDYAFCSDDCLRRFVEAPDRYAAAQAAEA